MNEDEITNALIRMHKSIAREAVEAGITDDDVEIIPEAHYDHYGNRGVVDLYTMTGGWEGHVYEIKSESAVRNATGANEIIRQFNKMRAFFFEGSNYPRPTSNLIFELCFAPTQYNAKHIIKNADLYAASVKTNLSKMSNIDVKRTVCFRLPDYENITPLLMFSNTFDFRNLLQDDEFENYAQGNPVLYRRIRSAFRDL